jgi:predicted protein tyrosine phosphatase
MKAITTLFVSLALLGASWVFAKDNSDAVVLRMKKDLSLSDEQVEHVTLIIKSNMIKRQKLLESYEGNFIASKKSIKLALAQIRQEENNELGQVLTKEQMKKLLTKQRVRDSLNKDQIDFGDGYGDVVLNPQGGSLKF